MKFYIIFATSLVVLASMARGEEQVIQEQASIVPAEIVTTGTDYKVVDTNDKQPNESSGLSCPCKEKSQVKQNQPEEVTTNESNTEKPKKYKVITIAIPVDDESAEAKVVDILSDSIKREPPKKKESPEESEVVVEDVEEDEETKANSTTSTEEEEESSTISDKSSKTFEKKVKLSSRVKYTSETDMKAQKKEKNTETKSDKSSEYKKNKGSEENKEGSVKSDKKGNKRSKRSPRIKQLSKDSRKVVKDLKKLKKEKKVKAKAVGVIIG